MDSQKSGGTCDQHIADGAALNFVQIPAHIACQYVVQLVVVIVHHINWIMRDIDLLSKHQRCKTSGGGMLEHIRIYHTVSLFHGEHGDPRRREGCAAQSKEVIFRTDLFQLKDLPKQLAEILLHGIGRRRANTFGLDILGFRQPVLVDFSVCGQRHHIQLRQHTGNHVMGECFADLRLKLCGGNFAGSCVPRRQELAVPFATGQDDTGDHAGIGVDGAFDLAQFHP